MQGDDGRWKRQEGLGSIGDMYSWRMRLGQRGWLRPTVLKILGDKPMNGIEIINSIHDMSHGWWRPSPGSIYPLLEGLCNEKIIRKNADGKYELTDKEQFSGQGGPKSQAEEVLTSMDGDISYLEELSQTDRKRFLKYRKRIAEICSRLSRLK